MTFKIADQQEIPPTPLNETLKIRSFRGTHTELATKIPETLAKLNINEIVWITQSESNGNITMMFVYK